MATRMEPEIFSREIVKPSSTGLDHPKSHTLSHFDVMQFPIYAPLVYFYANETDTKTEFNISDVLKHSLSKALSLYYPLAGRRNPNSPTIDCNDQGVPFLEARVCCSLSEVLNNKSLREDIVNRLIPDGLHYKDSKFGSPLVIQATYFDCGGMAIAICISHSIMDMSSLCCFINNWASLASKSCVPEQMSRPEFNFAALFPPIAHRPPLTDDEESGELKLLKRVTRSFIFDNAKIAKLKAAAAKEMGETPTRLEVVQALLFKCAVSSAARARSSSTSLIKQATLLQPVNLRTRVHPPFPETATGCFAGSFHLSIYIEDINKLEWTNFAAKIKNEKCKFLNEIANKGTGEELMRFLLKEMKSLRNVDHDLYCCNNWCRFPFYDADFGWGKPTWVTTARVEATAAMIRVIQMLDAKGGDGIEVLMVLDEQHMSLFESDQELLEFATVC